MFDNLLIPRSLPTNDWNKVKVTVVLDARKSIVIDTELLREKSPYFKERIPNDHIRSIEVRLSSVEYRELMVWKDWLHSFPSGGPRWFEHYGLGKGPPAEVELGAKEQWPTIPSIGVNTSKSDYCHHLCRLWIHGTYFGRDFQRMVMKRLRTITLSDSDDLGPIRSKATWDEPNWTKEFVLAPATLQFIYDSTTENDSTERGDWSLRGWTVNVVAARLNIGQLDEPSTHKLLPESFLNAVYQAKFKLVNESHRKELFAEKTANCMYGHGRDVRYGH
jgi:hypothetical protein